MSVPLQIFLSRSVFPQDSFHRRTPTYENENKTKRPMQITPVFSSAKNKNPAMFRVLFEIFCGFILFIGLFIYSTVSCGTLVALGVH
jgi:hypothetical protein